MSARPRLVEEGVPIYGPRSGDQPRRVPTVDDHEMNDHDGHPGQAGKTSAVLPASSSAASPNVVKSSLQMAAQKSSGFKFLRTKPPQSQTTMTHCQIGGSDTLPKPSPPAGKHEPNHPHSTWNHHSHHHNHHHNHHHDPHPTAHARQDHTIVGHDMATSHEMEMETELFLEHTQFHPVHHHPATNHQSYHSTQSVHPATTPMLQHPTGNYSSEISSPCAPSSQVSTSSVVQTSYTVGGINHQHYPATSITTLPLAEKMVGVEDHGDKAPLVVLDGANVAHAYGTAVVGLYSKNRGQESAEPDALGIQVAVDYFQSVGVRVLVVLPQYWFRSKARPGSSNWSDSMNTAQQQVLNTLQTKGLVVASPPADDDDAYALTIARREESRSLRRRNGEGPGFVLSNDMFRDAQERDVTGALKHWLNDGRNKTIGPGRISYSFADMGTINDHGERILDFVPNPRHPLVIWAEGMSLYGTALT